MSEEKRITEYHLIIAAAGSGSRLGSDIPKQYLEHNGKTLLRHTIDNLSADHNIKSIRVIIDPQHADLYQNSVTGLNLPSPITGGKERKDSIYKALQSCADIKDNEIVLIHDAARPFTKHEDIEKLLHSLAKYDAATLAAPVSDTLRKSKQDCASNIVERQGLWALQTPQAFRFGDLKKAHEQAKPDTQYTDDTSLITEMGLSVALVESARSNFKITTAEDWVMAKALFDQQTYTATGQGFDVHAFEDAPSGKPLMLCGVKIPHTKALKGHSDADVGLHALTDALLGAIGEGDIGQHFPPSDNTFKDMDSAIFLEKTVDMIQKRGGEILNCDVTLICEEPKIGPHRDAIKSRISEITNLPASRINIKATTTEQLGFTGRKEGIAAQAIATVKLPIE